MFAITPWLPIIGHTISRLWFHITQSIITQTYINMHTSLYSIVFLALVWIKGIISVLFWRVLDHFPGHPISSRVMCGVRINDVQWLRIGSARWKIVVHLHAAVNSQSMSVQSKRGCSGSQSVFYMQVGAETWNLHTQETLFGCYWDIIFIILQCLHGQVARGVSSGECILGKVRGVACHSTVGV